MDGALALGSQYISKALLICFNWQQIDDTVHIMKQNLHKASERGSQIDNLNETTRNLDKNSALFKRGARDLRLEMAWKNNKMRCWIALAILVIILVVVVPIGTALNLKGVCLGTLLMKHVIAVHFKH